MINVKSTPTPGFSKGSGSVCGKKPLVFFGFKGSVSKVSPFIDFDLLPLIVSEANTQGHCGVFEDSNRVNSQGMIKNTRTKIMSEMKEHAEGSYVYLVTPYV